MPLGLMIRGIDFFNIPFSAAIFERILLYCVFTGSGVSMYYLCIILIPDDKGKRFGALAASAFYMFNFYTMTTILPSGAMIMFEYAFFPLILALYINALNNRSPLKHSFMIAVVWALLITPAYITVSIAITDWIVILMYFLFYNIIEHDKKTLKDSMIFTSLLTVFWLLLNLFWILPLLSAVPAIIQLYGAITSGLKLYTINSVRLLDGLRLTGYWGLTLSFRGAHYYPWYIHFQTLPFVLLSFLPPLIAGMSFMLNSRYNKHVIFFGVLSICTLFMVRSPNPPLGCVNTWLFSVNLLSIAFRSSYQRFTGYLTLSYAFLISAFFSKICNKPSKTLWRDLARIIAILLTLFLLVGVLAWPIWKGDVFSTEGIIPSKRVSIPEYYYEAAQWLNQQSEDFSILPIPYPAKTASYVLWWQNGTEGYYGVYPFLLLSTKTFLMTNNVAEAVARSFAKGEPKDSRVLNYLNVKYVVVHWDADWAYIEDHPSWVSTSPQTLNSSLENIHGLVHEKSFGNIEFYRNLYWSPERVRVIAKDEYLNTSLSSLIPILGMGSFEKRMEMVIQKENGSGTHDVTVPVNITYQNGMSPDFNNMLFTFFNESTMQEVKIPHWIESKKEKEWALVWIKIPVFELDRIYRIFLYFGGDIPQTGNPGSFFRFFDDFEENGFSKWSIAEGNWKKDDLVKIEGNFSAKGEGSLNPFISDGSYVNAIFEGFFRFGEDNVNHYPFVSSDNTGSWNYWIVAKHDGRFGYFDGEEYKDYPVVTSYQPNVWYHIKLAVNFQEEQYWVWINDTLVTPSGLPTKNAQGTSGTHLINWRLLNAGGEQNGTMWIDVIRVYEQSNVTFSLSIGRVQSLWPSNLGIVSCSRTSPTEYHVIVNISVPSYILLNEPFENGWTMTLEGSHSTIDHFLAMEFFNGWSLESQGSNSMALIYSPQRTLDYGLAVSSSFFALAVTFLLIEKKLRWLTRTRKNRKSNPDEI
ncbi:MAG: DUF2341 domain-containing protein [Thermoproteota archaeon]